MYWEKKKTNIPFVRRWLESFFFFIHKEKVVWFFFFFNFPIIECWKGVREKSVGRVSPVPVLRSCSRKHAGSMLWFRPPPFIRILPAWNRKLCSDGSFVLLNFRSFCLYCMYFFRGFWGRPQTFRSARERGGTCLFPGYPPRLRLQSGLLCTCITEAPNKNTLWLACDKLSGCLFHGLGSGHEHAHRHISSSCDGRRAVRSEGLLPRQLGLRSSRTQTVIRRCVGDRLKYCRLFLKDKNTRMSRPTWLFPSPINPIKQFYSTWPPNLRTNPGLFLLETLQCNLLKRCEWETLGTTFTRSRELGRNVR